MSDEGAAVNVPDSVVVSSISTDWGSGATENLPADLFLYDHRWAGSEEGQAYTDLGASETFTCILGVCE